MRTGTQPQNPPLHTTTRQSRIRTWTRRFACTFAATLAVSACDSNGSDTDDVAPPPILDNVAPAAVSFDTATITFITETDSIRMPAEVADRPDQRAYGLMDRDELGADAGMIFLYEQVQSGDTGFWMYRTRIPLDIAYFDGSGRIVAIHQMMPCTSLDPQRCVGYAAGVPYFGAVEANRGWFTRNGIGVGDRIVMPGRLGA